MSRFEWHPFTLTQVTKISSYKIMIVTQFSPHQAATHWGMDSGCLVGVDHLIEVIGILITGRLIGRGRLTFGRLIGVRLYIKATRQSNSRSVFFSRQQCLIKTNTQTSSAIFLLLYAVPFLHRGFYIFYTL